MTSFLSFRRPRTWLSIVALLVSLTAVGAFYVYKHTVGFTIAPTYQPLEQNAQVATLLPDGYIVDADDIEFPVLQRPQSSAPASNNVGCKVAPGHSNPSQINVMVNKKYCMNPISYTPGDLTTIYGATLSAKASTHFKHMIDDAKQDGISITVTSSFRSYQTQVGTYNYWISVVGQAEADKISAKPGYSEHQTGYTVDLATNGGCALSCFGGTAQHKWLQANGHKYGFIQRYIAGYESTTGYSAEEWHWRYVGIAAATDMRSKGIKTLEQYWGLEGGNYAS